MNVECLSQPSPCFYLSAEQDFENNAGKGENAPDKEFLLFSQCFLPIWRTFCHFYQILNFCPQTLSVWKSLKFGHLGMS